MKNFIILIFCFLFLTSVKCKKENECHREITILNKSNRTVICAHNMKNYVGNCNLSGTVIKPSESYEDGTRDCWESEIYDQRYYDLYIIDTSKYNAPMIFFSCDSIEIMNIVLKHYVLTLDELKKNNFTISYP